MSAKQDRVAPRTAADIERKYNFGKKFSEILGLIDESRDHVDSVTSELKGRVDTATTLSRTAEEIAISAKAIAEDAASQVSLKLDADGVKTVIEKEIKVVRDEITDIENAQTELGNTQTELGNAQTELGNEIIEITNSLEFKMDAKAVDIAIEQKISAGVNVDEVETKTGYRFDAEGLKISKAGEEMSNMIDNTGMYVTRSGEDILVANNAGVTAVNLHAKTYLIIGAGNGRSRLEDYGTSRTGVFWVG